eukprot:1746398-Amphidinium_carterae.1
MVEDQFSAIGEPVGHAHVEANLYKITREETIDQRWEALIRGTQFKHALVYQFKSLGIHINSKELLAFRSALRHACRTVQLEHCRVTFGLDSQVCVWLLKRGRSSSTFLNHILQSCLPLTLATGITCRPVWISTQHNAADDATRNQPLRRAEDASPLLLDELASVEEVWRWPLAVTRLSWRDRGFDHTRGFPGEGPSATVFAENRDLRITVQPKTMERYWRRLQHFSAWLTSVSLPPWEDLAENVELLNSSLGSYIQKLHNDRAPYSYAIECLAALQMVRPSLQMKLQPAWRVTREWGKSLPVSVRCPMPLAVVLALAVTAWTLEWRRSAVCLLLGFEGLLRPMEMGGALRGHLALPCDLTGDTTSVVMAIPESKTSTRTVKMQSILVTDDKLVALLNYIYSHDAPRVPLCPGGLRGLQRRYLHLKLCLGIESAPWTLGSIRGGGAVEFMRRTQNVQYLQWKGRWSNPRNMAHYLQASLGITAFTSLPTRTRERVLELAHCAHVLFDVEAIARTDARARGSMEMELNDGGGRKSQLLQLTSNYGSKAA